jgi:hypothetical protein
VFSFVVSEAADQFRRHDYGLPGEDFTELLPWPRAALLSAAPDASAW